MDKTKKIIIMLVIIGVIMATVGFAGCVEKGGQGTQGTQGLQGIQGEQGSMGPQGPPGVNGTNGSQGPAGPRGEAGSTGPRGEKGEPGKNCECNETPVLNISTDGFVKQSHWPWKWVYTFNISVNITDLENDSRTVDFYYKWHEDVYKWWDGKNWTHLNHYIGFDGNYTDQKIILTGDNNATVFWLVEVDDGLNLAFAQCNITLFAPVEI